MVDEAKAFCPGCGHSFVVEAKRESVSNFESFDGTVQLSDTMFNQMLTDMGLNISNAPNPVEKRVEVIAPATATPTETVPPVVATPAETVSPVVARPVVATPVVATLAETIPPPVAAPAQVRPPDAVAADPKPKSNTKWFILGGVIIFVLVFLLILAAAVIVYMYLLLRNF